MISKTTIDKVFEQLLVEEVIGDFVQLKKSGANFKGLSPFSNEKTPSFVVSPVKQIWKDFSSGKGGNAVAFLMEHEHFTYPEAIKYLARKYNIEIEETQLNPKDKEISSERESLYIVSEYAKKFFKNTLNSSIQGKTIGLTYFRERGFNSDTIEKYDLGFSPNEQSYFSNSAIEKGYDKSFLEKSGLTIFQNSKSIDRFRGRVVFPIHSMSGRILGFDRTDSTKISFYLSIPALAGASALGIKDLFKENIEFNFLVIVGVFLSFFFSLITIKVFLKFVKNFSLNVFVVYRLFLAMVLFYIIYF